MMRILRTMAASVIPFTLAGCVTERMPILNPNGYVGEAEKELLYLSMGIMLLIIVPVIIGTLWIGWYYRDSRRHDDYDPDFEHSSIISKVTLYVPLLTIAVLGALNWIYTHRLDPYRPFGGEEKPYEIQAVALDFKWLFIYPDKGIATVNELVAPVDRPVTIRITSDPMMTSIFIPGLISQIYAMPGMETRANFQAKEIGVLDGSNAMYSGPGFSYQKFKTKIVSKDDFAKWLDSAASNAPSAEAGESVKQEQLLDRARYDELYKRTKGYDVTYFASVKENLFQEVVQKYRPEYRMNPLPTTKEYLQSQGHTMPVKTMSNEKEADKSASLAGENHPARLAANLVPSSNNNTVTLERTR